MPAKDRSRGRPVSWLSVVLMLTGFAAGGIALTLSNWWLFWTGGGVVLVGALLAVATDIFRDVLLDPLHQDQADPHVSPVHGVVASDTPAEVEPTLPGHGPQVTGNDGRSGVPQQGGPSGEAEPGSCRTRSRSPEE